MKKSLFILFSLLAFSMDVGAQNKLDKLTADEVVAKHLASIGTPEAIAAAKTRVLVGEGTLTAKLGTPFTLNSMAQIASQGDKILYTMIFNSTTYPYEKAAFDGKNTSLGLPNGKRTLLTDFLKSQSAILKDGLFTGTLSSAWPLLEIKSKKSVKLEYAGIGKVDGKQYYKLKYSSGRTGDLKVTLYFEPETFRHTRSEYEYSIEPRIGTSATDVRSSSRIERYFLTEEFSDFKTAGKLVLPLTYKITITNELQIESQPGTNSREWTVKIMNVYYDETLSGDIFKVS